MPIAHDEAGEHDAAYAKHGGVINTVELLGAFGELG